MTKKVPKSRVQAPKKSRAPGRPAFPVSAFGDSKNPRATDAPVKQHSGPWTHAALHDGTTLEFASDFHAVRAGADGWLGVVHKRFIPLVQSAPELYALCRSLLADFRTLDQERLSKWEREQIASLEAVLLRVEGKRE